MPWLDAVAAVLMAWFPGQEMGDVVGRCPVRRRRTAGPAARDVPASARGHPRRSSTIPGRNGVAAVPRASPGRLPLVRHRRAEPLFPFGHGLGYADVDDHRGAEPRSVHRRGRPHQRQRPRRAEVVQVYAHRDGHATARGRARPAPRRVRQVRRARRGSTTTMIVLDPRTYQAWDVGTHAWTEVPGSYELRVGTSSRTSPTASSNYADLLRRRRRRPSARAHGRTSQHRRPRRGGPSPMPRSTTGARHRRPGGPEVRRRRSRHLRL